MSNVEQTERLQLKLQTSLDSLIGKIGRVQIGNKDQFPLGWRKAAKGRTVWRILEELITQNLEKYYGELGIISITASDSEVTVYDFSILFEGEEQEVFVNIKSAVMGGPSRKDDISKFDKLLKFYESFPNEKPDFYIGTFFITFHSDMSFEIVKCVAFPIAWIPKDDIGINTSNNGNVQLKKYKDIADAEKKTSEEFYVILQEKVSEALEKKEAAAALKRQQKLNP